MMWSISCSSCGLLIAAATCVGVVVISLATRRRAQICNIPEPKGSFKYGDHAKMLGVSPEKVLRSWALEYGEMFLVRFGVETFVYLNSRKAVKDIFDRQSGSTSCKGPLEHANRLVHGLRLAVMPYGTEWRNLRAVVHQILTPKVVHTFQPIIDFESKQLLVDLLDRNKGHDRFSAHIQRYTFSVILTCIYGIRCASEVDENLQRVVQIMQDFGETTTPNAFPTNSWPWLGYIPTALQWWRPRAMKYYERQRSLWLALWDDLKAKTVDGNAPLCFAQRLLQTQDSDMTDLQASFLAGTMIEAGLDTSAGALNLLILFFKANPQAQRRVAEQVRRVVGQNRSPRAADLTHIPLIRSSVKEIFRIAPLMRYGTPHYVTRDIRYKSFEIPRGSFVVINQNALHFDESYFPEPFTFTPERYLDFPEGAGHYAHSQDPSKRDQYNFGAGRRICPGTHLAEASIELTLARILWAFDIVEPGFGEPSLGFKITDEYFVDGANKAARPFQAEFKCRNYGISEVIRQELKTAQAKDC